MSSKNSACDVTPIFLNAVLRWFRTVLWLRNRRVAIEGARNPVERFSRISRRARQELADRQRADGSRGEPCRLDAGPGEIVHEPADRFLDGRHAVGVGCAGRSWLPPPQQA
jgi:hypothetical protein